jgi:hypothetical protein
MNHEEVMRNHPMQRKLRGETVGADDWAKWEQLLKGESVTPPDLPPKVEAAPAPKAKPVQQPVATLTTSQPFTAVKEGYDEEFDVLYEVDADGHSIATIL